MHEEQRGKTGANVKKKVFSSVLFYGIIQLTDKRTKG